MKELSEVILPADLKYVESHEWISSAKPYRLGVSDFAQDQLGDLTHVELPEAGAIFAKGSEFGFLESIKSVSSVYLPIDAKIVAVNSKLADEPGLVNSNPYGEGWLIEIEPLDPVQVASLMSADAYLKFLEGQV